MTEDDKEQRLMEVEMQLAFQEDLLQSLNDVVIEQKKQMELMATELRSMREQVSGLNGNGAKNVNEKPPHY